jgi:hypothetical protein
MAEVYFKSNLTPYLCVTPYLCAYLCDYQTPMEVFVNLLGRAKLGELAAKQVNVQ